MDYPIRKLAKYEFPPLLQEIPEPPTQLYVRGELPPKDTKLLAVVGSRKYTTYGKQCVERLIGGLRGTNIAIVSGLALGIDGIAHRAALDAGLYTLAVPGSGLNDSVLYPARHRALATEILRSGGGILSEYDPDFRATTWSFPKRNRIMAGLTHATLVVEATERSGTLITSRLATDYNRDVLTIPGSIFSAGSAGPHMLIKLGATPVTSPEDILDAFGIEAEGVQEVSYDLAPIEQRVIALLTEPKDKDELGRALSLSTPELNTTLTMMELTGLIKIEMNVVYKNI